MKIGTKLGLGYGVIFLLILLLQFNAVRDVVALTNLLETVRVEALGALDIMDAFVGDLQREYIDSHKAMTGDGNTDISMFEDGDQSTREHLDKLNKAIFLSDEQKTGLRTLHQNSILLRGKLFSLHDEFSLARVQVVSSVREFVAFLSLVDERGEEEISELELESDKEITWDTGLGSTWQRAIQPLELKLDLLEHFDFVLRYLGGDNPVRTQRAIDSFQELHLDHVERMKESSLYLAEHYQNRTHMAGIEHRVKTYHQGSNKLIALHNQYQKALLPYEELQVKLIDLARSSQQKIERAVDVRMVLVRDSRDRLITAAIVFLVVALAIILALHLFVRKMISSPLENLAALALRFSRGDFDVSFFMDRKDEIGQLGASLETMKDNLGGSLEQLKITSDVVKERADQLSEMSLSLSQRISEQASSIEEIQASTSEISSHLKYSSEQAGQSSERMKAAMKVASTGMNTMRETVDAMQAINRLSREISTISSTIDNISFQTNLLALNAAVEAARAGSEGKGFAVVADEVRSLASRSGSSAKEITELIQSAVERIQHGVVKIEETSGSLDDISVRIGELVEYHDEIVKSSAQQASAVSQIDAGMHHINEAAAGIMGQTQDLETQASKLQENFKDLGAIVESFRLEQALLRK
jgi:methyl-accepting chemotaxis protein